MFKQELDYTFVGISPQDVNELREKHNVIPVRLNKTRLAVDVDDVIHIPQHPQGRQKRISFSTVCLINESEVFYKADTSFGSSGSPVLYSQSNDMHVLALHKSGGVTLPDGRLANRGILLSAILDHVCRQSGRFLLYQILPHQFYLLVTDLGNSRVTSTQNTCKSIAFKFQTIVPE